MTGFSSKFVEPSRVPDRDTREYLNELVRALREFSGEIFSTESGAFYSAARVRPFISVNTDYEVGQYDSVILVDAPVSSRTITLPTALEAEGTFLDIKKIDANGSTVVSVEGSGPELPIILNGSLRPSVTLFSDGEDFWVI